MGTGLRADPGDPGQVPLIADASAPRHGRARIRGRRRRGLDHPSRDVRSTRRRFPQRCRGTPEAEAFDATTATIAGVFLLAVVIAGIFFLAWLSRSVEIAPAIGAAPGRFSPRAAIGWWFVPLANFVIPYRIVADLHDRLATPTDGDRARPLLVGWWLAWIGGNLLGYVAGLTPSDTIDQLRTQYLLAMVSDAINAGAAILAIFVIQRIVAREDGRAAAATEAVVATEPAA